MCSTPSVVCSNRQHLPHSKGRMGLNEEQLIAVNTRDGFYRCTAVPGSGKTTVFVARAVAILREGTPAHKLLGLTFTKSAAENMEAKVKVYEKLDGRRYIPEDVRVFRTFHGWALNFARNYHESFPFAVSHSPLLLPAERYQIMVPILRASEKRVKYKDVTSYISEMKRRDITPEQAYDEADGEAGIAFSRVYAAYEEKCQDIGKLDFDSLLTQTVRLLETRSDILHRVRPDYLQVDESQDTDSIQWSLVRLLGSDNVFCVGDENQNMFSWRGSEADGLAGKFEERFPGNKILTLSTNYRSTRALIRYFKEIAPIQNAGVAGMCTVNDEGVPPEFYAYKGEEHEAESILGNLVDPDNTAVLARTNRQLGAFEKVAGRMEIKYKLIGKSGFFSNPEVEFTVAFAQYCAGAATDNTVKKIIRSPYDACRHIKKAEAISILESMQSGTVGQASMARLLGHFHSGDYDQDGYIRQLHALLEETRREIVGKWSQDALRCVITKFGILNHYRDNEDVGNDPADNVLALLRMAEKKGTLLEFVQMCHKAKQASRSTVKRLSFSTIHQAKGLEWNHVHVIGVDHEILPHKNGDLEEEKRIYYVACTRAAKRLYVSTSGVPSEFIKHKVTTAPDSEPDFLDQMYRNAQGIPE